MARVRWYGWITVSIGWRGGRTPEESHAPDCHLLVDPGIGDGVGVHAEQILQDVPQLAAIAGLDGQCLLELFLRDDSGLHKKLSDTGSVSQRWLLLLLAARMMRARAHANQWIPRQRCSAVVGISIL